MRRWKIWECRHCGAAELAPELDHAPRCPGGRDAELVETHTVIPLEQAPMERRLLFVDPRD